MKRRAWLQSAAALGLVSSTRLFAAPTGAPSADTPRFLFVFLRGGYDAMSLLVPKDNAFYAESRRNIAIAPDAVLPLDANWSLHPALKASIQPLVERRQAAFIPFAGTNDTSRSHFETQDSIELGQDLSRGPSAGPLPSRPVTPPGGGDGMPSPGADVTARNFDSGFMNRLALAIGTVDSISFTDQLPLAFRGEAQVGNVSLRTVGRSGVTPKMRGLLADMYRGQPLGPQVQAGFALNDEINQGEMNQRDSVGGAVAANRNAVTAKGFELEARRVARLMRERHALGFIDIGGWDTHVNQGAATGYLASRFEELGHGLAGFADEVGPEVWRNTVVMVVSEFGRTWRENGNRGTDHGHGSVHWVLGGSLACASVAGEQMKIDQPGLFQNRDLPVLNEYRSVLGSLFMRQFGLSADTLQSVFPGAQPSALQLI